MLFVRKIREYGICVTQHICCILCFHDLKWAIVGRYLQEKFHFDCRLLNLNICVNEPIVRSANFDDRKEVGCIMEDTFSRTPKILFCQACHTGKPFRRSWKTLNGYSASSHHLSSMNSSKDLVVVRCHSLITVRGTRALESPRRVYLENINFDSQFPHVCTFLSMHMHQSHATWKQTVNYVTRLSSLWCTVVFEYVPLFGDERLYNKSVDDSFRKRFFCK